ncbi:hypothetical protein PIB30_054380 [Stylosanthes scabra]|uniref:Uncharacterized protein n=1 Tax=Stylosanthes scabra TaxID=79078 RepID=A0ABU6TJC7_9FABA|nr:hypothetical protein [Stylosanthes scabra]
MNLKTIKLCAIKVWPITLTWQQYLIHHLLETWARKSVQQGLRRRGNGRCGHSLLGLTGRRDLNLHARPHIMCMTGAGTTLTLLCRWPVTVFSATSTTSPLSPPSTAFSHAPNSLRGNRILNPSHPTTTNPWSWSSCQPSSSSLVACCPEHLRLETAVGVEGSISVWPRPVSRPVATDGMHRPKLGTSS